jgi:TonB-linked SusC/RagA family outer membrane protein
MKLPKTFQKSLLSRFAVFLLAGIILFSPFTLSAQQRSLSGTVTGTDKEPLPGATVSIKGTTSGTSTGLDGKYVLSVPANATTMVFSFVGMQPQEISIGTGAVYDVVMSEGIQVIEEVVIIGYGTQKKVNLTGAVSTIKVDARVSSRALSNISSGLAGLAPGLEVTQNTGMAGKDGASLLIRGIGTANNTRPLIVVDGMPDVDINRINMNDIESISVLKDATSSAVYGSRAANGVILVTTKTGKGMGKTSININSSYAMEVPTKSYKFMYDYPRALTLHQRAAAVNTLRSNSMFKDGTIDQWMALGMIDPLRYPETDVWNTIMRDGAIQNTNVSASGSNDKSNFYISAGMMNQKGLQINNDYSINSIRFNYDYKMGQKMNIGAKFSGNWSKYSYALPDGFTDNYGNAFTAFSLQYAISGITPYDPVTGYFGGVMAYNEDPTAMSPYNEFTNNLTYRNRQEANPSLYWDWTPIKGLTARIDYALNYYNQFQWNAPIPSQAYNFQTQTFGSRVYVGENAGVSNSTNTGYKTQLNGRLNYQFTIAADHNIDAMVAYSEEYWYDRYQYCSRNDRLYPTLHEIDAALTDIQSTGGNSSTEGMRSYIGRLDYSAYGRYLLEFNFRYDGSSKFVPGHQFGFFPSVALGWRFTKENFVKSITVNWLNNGKLRMSYGSLGNNSGVGRYEQQETLMTNNYMYGGTTYKGFVNSKMINQNLSWESTNVFNIGLDLGFLKNRLTSEIDFYDRFTTGMNRPTDLSTLLAGSYSAPRTNIGDLRNRGIEGNFTWHDAYGSFNYSVTINASYNKSTLLKWNSYLGRGNMFLNMPLLFLYIYEDSGIAQTWQDVYNATPQGAQPGDILRKDLNGDGRIDGNDMKAYPNIQRYHPTTFFSLNGNLSWKGIDLNLLFQGSSGRKDIWLNVYNNVNFGTQRYASTWEHWTNPWSLDNRNGEWPRLGGNFNRNDQSFWLSDMTYLRIKNVQLGYTLPVSWLRKIGNSTLRLYASGENLFTLTKFKGLDPEKEGSTSDAYPLNRSYLFGINIGF